jgi:hypothetical protein
MLLTSLGTAWAGEAQDKTKAQLDPAAYAFFQGEIKDAYPDHVKLYAIATATVEKAGSALYCPLRTAQCGLNPTCSHPKQTVATVDLKVVAPLFKVGDGELPKAFTNYTLFSGGDFKAGDVVQVSLYVYAGSPSNISKIRKVEAAAEKTPTGTAKPEPDAKPKEVAIIQQWQGLYPVALLNQLPDGQREAGTGYVVDAKTFATLWKAWKGEEKAPAVDFQKNFVVFTRNVQYLNMIRIGGVMLKDGVADVVAMETMSANPIEDKLHMSAAVIAREGVKSVRAGDKTVPVPAAESATKEPTKEPASPKNLAGKSFVSKEKHEVGRGAAMGTWSLRFTETSVSWRYSDVVETFRYTLAPDGTITTSGSMRPGSVKARYFPDRNEIEWDGAAYKAE